MGRGSPVATVVVNRLKPAKNRRSIVPIKLGAIQGSGGAGMNAHTDGCLM